MSRPRKNDCEKKSVVKGQRWTGEQWEEIEDAARIAGMKPSSLVRAAVLSQVRDIRGKVAGLRQVAKS